MAYRVECEEHGIKVSGCNCVGAKIKRISPCPHPEAHEALLRQSSDQSDQYNPWKDMTKTFRKKRK